MAPFEILGTVADVLGILLFVFPLAYSLFKKNLNLEFSATNRHYPTFG